MRIKYSKTFKKHFQQRIFPDPKLCRRFQNRLDLFIQNKNHPLLKTHRLKGSLNDYWSFSVTGDVRVIYQLENQTTVILFDVGTHNQVY